MSVCTCIQKWICNYKHIPYMPSTKIISTNTTVHPTVPPKHLLQCSPLCWAIAKADDVLPTSYRKAVSHGEVCQMEVVGWCWEEMTFRFISQIHITPNMHPKLRIESTMQISYKLGKSWNHTTQFLRFSKKLSTKIIKNPVRSDSNPDSRVSINCAWNWPSSFCSFKKKHKEIHVLTDHLECNESYCVLRWVVIIFKVLAHFYHPFSANKRPFL